MALRSSRCLRCLRRRRKCSTLAVGGSLKTNPPILVAYRTWRWLRTACNPDIYSTPIFVSQKWSNLESEDVPTWFVEWRDKVSKCTKWSDPRDWGDDPAPECSEFPVAPPRPRIVLDDEDIGIPVPARRKRALVSKVTVRPLLGSCINYN